MRFSKLDKLLIGCYSTFTMTRESRQETQTPEMSITSLASQAMHVLRHRTELLGRGALRDAVTFNVSKLEGFAGRTPGHYSYMEAFLPDVELLEEHRKWNLGNQHMSQDSIAAAVKKIDEQLTAPRSRDATLTVQPETGEQMRFSVREVADGSPAQLFLEAGKESIEMRAGDDGQWLVATSLTNGIGLTSLESMTKVLLGVEKPLHTAIKKAEIERLQALLRRAEKMPDVAFTLSMTRGHNSNETVALGPNIVLNAGRPLHSVMPLPISDEAYSERIHEALAESSRSEDYQQLLYETRKGRRTSNT